MESSGVAGSTRVASAEAGSRVTWRYVPSSSVTDSRGTTSPTAGPTGPALALADADGLGEFELLHP